MNDSAEVLYRQALAIDRRRYGDSHLVVAEDLNDLGVTLAELGKLAASDSAATAVLAIRQRWWDPGHPGVILALHNLAAVRYRQGNYEESERMKRDVLQRRRRLYPDGHPDVAMALRELGSVISAQGRHEEAESLLVQAYVMQRSLLAPAHPETFLRSASWPFSDIGRVTWLPLNGTCVRCTNISGRPSGRITIEPWARSPTWVLSFAIGETTVRRSRCFAEPWP